MKFIHIINPVEVSVESDLFTAQPITFESMKRAKAFCKTDLEVELITAQFEEDRSLIPNYFYKTLNLERSILDKTKFKKNRKLPYISDIMDRALKYADKLGAEYIIYSNVDIGLMPNFYQSIRELLDRGFDAIAVNRKTVSDNYESINELPLIYSDIGSVHEGIDTFVMKREALEKFYFSEAIIGSGPVGLVFSINMVKHSRKFLWLENSDLTFHIGDDKAWIDKDQIDIIDFSYQQLHDITYKFYKRVSFSLKNKLFRETLRMSKEIIHNPNFDGKLVSRYHPKLVLSQISSKNKNCVFD